MKEYKIVKLSTMWSTETLKINTENLVNEKVLAGYEIVSVAFGVNLWWMPTSFVTIRK